MAIINNNVENVKFLRNQRPFESREAARIALGNNKGVADDGTSLLARYSVEESGATVIKTIVGYVAVVGETHHLTIIDVEGASEDIEKLREEINAKLGNGIGSGASETVTAQLTALSGNGESTSAETSVEGAKRYADELKSQMDYSGVTTGDGVYVTNVTQADGIVSATTATLPSVTGEVESKKVVMSVSEDKGEIAVTKGTIESSDKTVVIGDLTEGNGIDFKVNIDNVTLEKNENGVISVTSSALTQYVGDDDTIQISAAVEGVKTVSSPLTIEKITAGLDADVREAYRLVGHSGNTIGELVKIYKDSSLLSVALLHADTTATPQVLPTYNKETDTWTDIATPTEANQALCFAYENISGATVIAAVPVGAFINEQEFASGITWDSAAGKVKGVVDSTSETFLTVGTNGFKLSGVQDAINAAVSGLDADVSGTTEHIKVNVVEEDGVITTVTVEEDNIANANDLAELSAKTVTALTSTNGSITAQIDDAAGCKTYDIETDADKIKMSGFSADATSALSGIATSDSIATAFEKTNTVITENERVTAEALNNLNTRVDTVSGDVDTIKQQYISGVSVNGNAVTVANKVAPISITAATSAATATSTEAIVVDTDANGNITLGIANIDCGYYA